MTVKRQLDKFLAKYEPGMAANAKKAPAKICDSDSSITRSSAPEGRVHPKGADPFQRGHSGAFGSTRPPMFLPRR